MEIRCNNCNSLWIDELFIEIVAGNVKGDIRCPVTKGCIARLITFLNQYRHVVGIEGNMRPVLTNHEWRVLVHPRIVFMKIHQLLTEQHLLMHVSRSINIS
jgi:hypothetical protein